jgi:hypothetical protein
MLAFGVLWAASASAAERDAQGYYRTGEGIRYKKVAFIDVKVYDITSLAKELPPAHSKEAMIALDADKKLAWKMLRSVGAEKIKKALRESYAQNGYSEQANIESIIQPIAGEVKEGEWVTIAYDAASKTTTLSTGGRQAKVAGVPFMRATWSIWFGKIDQPALSEALLKELP